MKFLIIGDLHGNKLKIHFRDFDAIIAPGDFCLDEARKYMFQALRWNMQNPNANIEWYDIVGKKRAKKIVQRSIAKGREILEELNSFGVPVYTVPGNWDWTGDKDAYWYIERENHWKKILIKGLKNVFDVYHRRISTKEFDFIGHGITSGPEYPQYKKDKKRLTKKESLRMKKEYKKLYARIAKLFQKASRPVIYLSHNVPFHTKLDKITNKESPRYGYHYGSFVSRKIIERYQPLVCIGGHMHEHFGKDKIGRTIIINAGFGSEVNTLLEIEKGKIKRLEFWDGKKIKK